MRFLYSSHDNSIELSLDDVYILSSFWEGISRSSVALSSSDFPGTSHPLVSANRNTVMGKHVGRPTFSAPKDVQTRAGFIEDTPHREVKNA